MVRRVIPRMPTAIRDMKVPLNVNNTAQNWQLQKFPYPMAKARHLRRK